MPSRPAPDEHSAYFGRYIGLVPDGDIRRQLHDQLADTTALLAGVDEARANRAYAPGKWTLKEALLHVIDAERVFAYRLLRIARGDTTPLPGFEQDDWVPVSGANARPLAGLLDEMARVRAATVSLVDSLDDAAWLRRGTASGSPVSARAIAYIIAGHELQHRSIFRERYLG